MADMAFFGGVSMLDILSDEAPLSEAGAPKPGSMPKAPRVDHQHPRLTSSTAATLGSNGEVTVTFTRSFPVQPSVICTLIEAADNQPVIFKVKSWVQDANGNYTAAVVKGYRLTTLPASLTLLSALISFNISGGSSAGAQFSCIALAASTV